MVELVDATDSKSVVRKDMWVRVPPSALSMQSQGGGLVVDKHQVFAQWNETKIQLDARPHPDFYFYEREVWWAALGQNIGHEINGKHANFERPVLILKKYSRYTCLVLPLTTVIRPGASWQFPLQAGGKNAAALLNESCSISTKRLLKKIDRVEIDVFVEIVTAYFELIKYNNPALGGAVELPAKPDEPIGL